MLQAVGLLLHVLVDNIFYERNEPKRSGQDLRILVGRKSSGDVLGLRLCSSLRTSSQSSVVIGEKSNIG